jgi:hypothetical protein
MYLDTTKASLPMDAFMSGREPPKGPLACAGKARTFLIVSTSLSLLSGEHATDPSNMLWNRISCSRKRQYQVPRLIQLHPWSVYLMAEL